MQKGVLAHPPLLTCNHFCISPRAAGPGSGISTIPWKPEANIASLVQLKAVLEATLACSTDAQDLLTDYVTTL